MKKKVLVLCPKAELILQLIKYPAYLRFVIVASRDKIKISSTAFHIFIDVNQIPNNAITFRIIGTKTLEHSNYL